MIRGIVTNEGYFVEAEVLARPSGRAAQVTFLVDSGASATAIHPSDIPKLEIPGAVLQEAEGLRHTVAVGPGHPQLLANLAD